MGQTQTQVVTVTRVCDHCEKSVVITQPVTPEQLAAVANWYVVSKEHLVGEGLMPISKLACSRACAHAMIDTRAIELPTDAGAEPVDMTKVN